MTMFREELAKTMVDDKVDEALSWKRSHPKEVTDGYGPDAKVILRMAAPEDAPALKRLGRISAGDWRANQEIVEETLTSERAGVLVAEVEGETVAALRLNGEGPIIAAPVTQAAGVVELLRMRAAYLGSTGAASRN